MSDGNSLKEKLISFYLDFTNSNLDSIQDILTEKNYSNFIDIVNDDDERFVIEKETEENWSKRDLAITNLQEIIMEFQKSLLSDDSCSSQNQIDSHINQDDSKSPNDVDMKLFILDCSLPPLCFTLLSLRTALVLNACNCFNSIIDLFPKSLPDSYTSKLLLCFIKLAGQAKKITSNAAINSIKILGKHSSISERLIEVLNSNVNDSNMSILRSIGEFINSYLKTLSTPIIITDEEKNSMFKRIGDIIMKLSKDSNGIVRTSAREAFFVYQLCFMEYAKVLFTSSDISIQKAIIRDAQSKNMKLFGEIPNSLLPQTSTSIHSRHNMNNNLKSGSHKSFRSFISAQKMNNRNISDDIEISISKKDNLPESAPSAE